MSKIIVKNEPTNDQINRLGEFKEVFDTFNKEGYLSRSVTHAQLTELAFIHVALFEKGVPNLSCASCKADMLRELSKVTRDYAPKRARKKTGQYKGDDPKTKNRDESKKTGKGKAKKKTTKKKPTPKKK